MKGERSKRQLCHLFTVQICVLSTRLIPDFRVRKTAARGTFLESPENYRAWKPIRKTPTRLFYEAGLFPVKGIKIKITSKFRASRRLCFEDTKRIMSPEMRPKSFGTFEKRAPVPDCPKAS